MSVPPAVRKVSEAAFLKAVVQLAQTLGWRVHHHHDSRRQIRPGVFVGDRHAAGFPDLVCVRGGRVLFIELKTEKGKLRPAQMDWMADLQRVEGDTGGRVVVRVWRPSDWDSGLVQRTLARA